MHMQMAVQRVSDRAAAYGVRGVTVDGLDVSETYAAAREAIDLARSGGGPTLLEARVARLTPHSSDDDDTTYRSPEDKAALKLLDPLPPFRERLIKDGVLNEAQAKEIEERALAEVDEAQRFAENAPFPEESWGAGPVFCE
jgi:2-oxoisovalerate dehydrogenase E1 component alpha subunit